MHIASVYLNRTLGVPAGFCTPIITVMDDCYPLNGLWIGSIDQFHNSLPGLDSQLDLR
jgi:hypothetical protein